MSRAAPRRLQIALTDLTGELSPATTLAAVQAVWEHAAGSAVASAARPTAAREGVLSVACESAAWAQELELMGDELLGRLNAELGRPELHALRCRTG
jgi:predicted nucleic acid-binding Zn ribbon protein